MQSDIKNLTFEEAMEELETVVRQLESGKIKLDEAVAVYEQGVKLKNFCAEKLKSAQAKIDKLIIEKNGTISGKEDFNNDITN